MRLRRRRHLSAVAILPTIMSPKSAMHFVPEAVEIFALLGQGRADTDKDSNDCRNRIPDRPHAPGHPTDGPGPEARGAQHHPRLRAPQPGVSEVLRMDARTCHRP